MIIFVWKKIVTKVINFFILTINYCEEMLSMLGKELLIFSASNFSFMYLNFCKC